MDSSFRNANPMVLVNYFDSYYCSLKPPDCSLYSEDGHEFPVHKVSFFFYFNCNFLKIRTYLLLFV